MISNVTYLRETTAKLIVRVEGGEEWDATDDDIRKFGRDIIEKGFYDFRDAVQQILGDNGLDLGHKDDNAILDPIVELAATIIYHGFDWRTHLSTRDKRVIAALEHALRAMFARDESHVSMRPALYDNQADFEHVPISPWREHVDEAQRLLDTSMIEE